MLKYIPAYHTYKELAEMYKRMVHEKVEISDQRIIPFIKKMAGNLGCNKNDNSKNDKPFITLFLEEQHERE